jgi:hypothetical protein
MNYAQKLRLAFLYKGPPFLPDFKNRITQQARLNQLNPTQNPTTKTTKNKQKNANHVWIG